MTTEDVIPTATYPYNSVMLDHGAVSSCRAGVNVMPGCHRGHLNNYYPRARGNVREYVEQCVRDTITNVVKPGWLHRVGMIAVREDVHERGLYHFTVWSDPKHTDVTR